MFRIILKQEHLLLCVALVAITMLTSLTTAKSQSFWENEPECYDDPCTPGSNTSAFVEVMGCTLTVNYKSLDCGVYTALYISSVTMNPSGGCATLYGYLYPTPGVLDGDRLKEVFDLIYQELMIQLIEPLKNNYQCPSNWASFTYWWEGSCSKACDAELENGHHVYTTVSCKDDACCGKLIEFCWDSATSTWRKQENKLTVGVTCPLMPFEGGCPIVGSTVGGLEVINVEESYCSSNCD